MKKRRGAFTVTALTVGLCLVAVDALAWDFDVTNSSGDSVQVKCSTANITTWPAHGETIAYLCDGTASVQRPGSTSEYNIPNDCGSDYVKVTTVTAGATATTLSLAHQCIYEEDT